MAAVPEPIKAALHALLRGHSPTFVRPARDMICALLPGPLGPYRLFLPLQTCRWPDKAALACGLAGDRGRAAADKLAADADARRQGFGRFPAVRQIWEIRGVSKVRLVGYDIVGGGSPFVNVFVYVVDQLEYPKPAWNSRGVRLLEVVLGVRM